MFDGRTWTVARLLWTTCKYNKTQKCLTEVTRFRTKTESLLALCCSSGQEVIRYFTEIKVLNFKCLKCNEKD